jgi:hypothetical protein
MKDWFSWVVWIGLVGLGVWVLVLTRQNAVLRREIEARDASIAAMAVEGGLRVGDRVEALRTFDPDGAEHLVAFDEGHPATLILLVSRGCGACDATLPLWEAMSEADLAGARVVMIDAGARTPAELEGYSARFPTRATTPDHTGWLREIPLTPSALAIGPGGRVLGVWYGWRASARTPEIAGVLSEAAGG